MTRANWKNDGSGFEEVVTFSCQQYENRGMALIRKTPNPWIIQRRGAHIVGAIPNAKERLIDYMGNWEGRAIAFEAKSTLETTRFDLANIAGHQFTLLRKWHVQGGISFVLIEFPKMMEVYFMPILFVERYWIAAERGGRKSIPYADIRLGCDPVKQGRGIALDFLKNAKG